MDFINLIPYTCLSTGIETATVQCRVVRMSVVARRDSVLLKTPACEHAATLAVLNSANATVIPTKCLTVCRP